MNKKLLSLASLLAYISLFFCFSVLPFQVAGAEQGIHCASASQQKDISPSCCEGAEEALSNNASFIDTRINISFAPLYSFSLLDHPFFFDTSLPLVFSTSDPPPHIFSSFLYKETLVLIC